MITKRFVLVFTILLLSIALIGCQQNVNEPEVNTPPVEEPAPPPDPTPEPEPTEEPTPVVEPGNENLVWFDTDDGIFHILYPEGWATNVVPTENGFAFGIAPTVLDFSNGPALFDKPAIMVFGSVRQIPPELAAKEEVVNFHLSNFYGESSVFNFQMVGTPVTTEPTEWIIYYISQATAELETGVVTHWMLGTALSAQTVVTFGVGVPEHAMETYGDLAMQMFNSVEIDTEITWSLIE